MINLLAELFHIHRYRPWGIIQQGEVVVAGTTMVEGQYCIQERTCQKCGWTQRRKTTT